MAALLAFSPLSFHCKGIVLLQVNKIKLDLPYEVLKTPPALLALFPIELNIGKETRVGTLSSTWPASTCFRNHRPANVVPV